MLFEPGADGVQIVLDAGAIAVGVVGEQPAAHGRRHPELIEPDTQEMCNGHGSYSSRNKIPPTVAALTCCDKMLP